MAKFRHYFNDAVTRHYPDSRDDVMHETDKNFQVISKDTQFAATSGNPIDKRLDFCAYFLALIETLDRRGEEFEQVRRICLEVVTEYVRPKNMLHAFAKRIPPKLVGTWLGRKLSKLFDAKISRNKSKDGFIARVITDKDKTYGLGYGIDIIECGICKLFKKHNYYKYASILCEVDEVTSALAGLRLIRTGTIANGASKCDFRFQRS